MKAKEKRWQTLEDEHLVATMVIILQASPNFLSKIAFSPPKMSQTSSSLPWPLSLSYGIYRSRVLGAILEQNNIKNVFSDETRRRRDLYMPKPVLSVRFSPAARIFTPAVGFPNFETFFFILTQSWSLKFVPNFSKIMILPEITL